MSEDRRFTAGAADSTPGHLDFAAVTHTGLVRHTNQDRYLAEPPLFVLADGMGGQAAGEIAAQIVIDTLKEGLARGRIADGTTLASAVTEANARVRDAARRDPSVAGMGTTCCGLLVDGTRGHLVHIGDSRAYLLRGGRLLPLTQDHTAVGQLVRDGLMSDQDAAVHPQRHVLSRAVGASDEIDVDRIELEFRADDRVLLCSDGLSGVVEEDAIERIVAAGRPDIVASRLVDAALEEGGHDNVTVLVVDPGELGPLRAGPAASEVPAAARRRRGRTAAGIAAALALAAIAVWGAMAGRSSTDPTSTDPTSTSPTASTGPQPAGTMGPGPIGPPPASFGPASPAAPPVQAP